MPVYKITIQLKSGEIISGLRENNNLHIDPVYIEYFTKATQFYQYNNIVEFDCVMISRNSKTFQAHAERLNRQKNIEPGFIQPARRSKF